MIIITIQSVSESKNDTVIDGKPVETKQAQEYLNDLFRRIRNIKLTDDNQIIDLGDNKVFCTLKHPKKDAYDRIRTALILYDKSSDRDLLKQSIELMGLCYADYEKLTLKHSNTMYKQYGLIAAIILLALMLCMIVLIK